MVVVTGLSNRGIVSPNEGGGVHTRVRTTGPENRNRMIGNFSDREGQQFLDTTAVALRLPANEVRTVVFQAESNMHDRASQARASLLKTVDDPLSFRLLNRIPFRYDLLEDGTRAIRVAHVHIGSGQVQLRTDLGHCHRVRIQQTSLS